MHTQKHLTFAALLTATALLLPAARLLAQNAAPAQQDVPAHVPKQDAAQAANQAADAHAAADKQAPEDQSRVLDSVVAIINGDVLLESDVEQERSLEALQVEDQTPTANAATNGDTLAAAAQRLISRTLIVQRMKAQQEDSSASITAEQVDKALDEVRKSAPGCVAAHCDTADGWSKFLAAHGLTVDEVRDSWRLRLSLLNYLDLRFRSGIRIPKADIQKYYQEKLVPEYAAKHVAAPPVKKVSAKIEDILVEQQVNKQIDDWEQTLRQEGSVKILVPAYGPSTNGDEDDETAGDGA